MGSPDKMPTPEQMAKLHESRISEENCMLQDGAVPKFDKQGNQINLIPTGEQRSRIEICGPEQFVFKDGDRELVLSLEELMFSEPPKNVELGKKYTPKDVIDMFERRKR